MKKAKSAIFGLVVIAVVIISSLVFSSSNGSIGISLFELAVDPYLNRSYSPALTADLASGECLKSFADFAYHIIQTPDREAVMSESWLIESALPPHQLKEYYSAYTSQVELIRQKNGRSEIWIRAEIHASDYSEEPYKQMVYIYQPRTRTWERLSGYIGDTNFFVKNLFMTADGTIWGSVDWYRWDIDLPAPASIPVLSRFNEQTRRFEFAHGALEIPVNLEQNAFYITHIVPDRQGNFWIFAHDEGIYRYDPDNEVTEKITDLQGVPPHSTTLAPDGSIYFLRDRNAWGMSLALSDIEMLRFVPETGEILPVELPAEESRAVSGILFDRMGRLWLGSIAYRDDNNTWNFVYPRLYAQRYFAGAGYGHYIAALPVPVLESSDGLLWFVKFTDSSWDGTAWYNPDTDEGCMFTDVAANVVEDSRRQLWLVADGKLYKHALD